MTLTDAGALIALLDAADNRHKDCAAALQRVGSPLVTTCHCLTEAMYLLGKAKGVNGQRQLWRIIQEGLLTIAELDAVQQERMRECMEQYADRPCDLADASLLALAETMEATQIFTIDSDFYIYRFKDGQVLQAVPGAG